MQVEGPERDSRKTGLSSWARRNAPSLLAFLLLSWVVISFSLPCALVETFLRQAAAEFEKVSLSVSLAWHLEINRESFWVYKQTIDWTNDVTAFCDHICYITIVLTFAFSWCLRLVLWIVLEQNVLGDEYVKSNNSNSKEQIQRKKAWECLCATLSEMHGQPLERKN